MTPTPAATSAWAALRLVGLEGHLAARSRPRGRRLSVIVRQPHAGVDATQGSPARSREREPAALGQRVAGGQDHLVGVVDQVRQLELGGQQSGTAGRGRRRAPGRRRRTRSRRAASSGSASIIDSSTLGWRSWKAATARGASVAPPLWKRDQPQPPAAQAGEGGQLVLGGLDAGEDRVGVARPARRPASVRRTPRAPRSTSWVPVSRSSAATCWDTADWVKRAPRPRRRTSPGRRPRAGPACGGRRASAQLIAHRRKSSFGLMAAVCDPRRLCRAARGSCSLTLSALLGRVLPVHQGRARGRRGARRDRVRAHRARGAGAAAARGCTATRWAGCARTARRRSWCSRWSRWPARSC